MYYLIKVNFIQIGEKIIQNTNQKDPYILPTAKYIVRVNNKKDTRNECLLFGHEETLLHRRRATRALRGRMPVG